MADCVDVACRGRIPAAKFVGVSSGRDHPFVREVYAMLIALLVFGIVAAGAILLGAKTDILRDAEPFSFVGSRPPSGGEYRRPYSLAQTQMAWWFCIIVGSFVYVYFSKHLLNDVLNKTSLILMGIGTGTALGAAIVDQTKTNSLVTLNAFKTVVAQIVQTEASGARPSKELTDLRDTLAAKLASQNFLLDVLTDADGVSLHRFQSLVWTGLLGIIFVVDVLANLRLPVFDNFLLAILGISGGTYLGFKIPEQPA